MLDYKMGEQLVLLFTKMTREANAYYEFLDATQESRIEILEMVKTRSPGILVARVRVDGDLIGIIRQAFQKKYWVLNSLLKVSAVYSAVRVDDERAIVELSERLNAWLNGSKYRVTLHRVKGLEMRNRIIDLVTSKIEAPVDLENYAHEIIVYYVDSKLYFVLDGSNEVVVEKLGPPMET